MRRRLLALLSVLGACKDDSREDGVSDTEYIGEDVPAGNCGETENEPCTSSGTGAMPSGCQASGECSSGESCSAVFDGDIGAFACRASCIEDFDETRWCIDDAGCCGPDSRCQGRGYCGPNGGTGAADGSSTGDAGTTSAGGAAGPISR